MKSGDLGALSARQLEVLGLLAQGLANKDIAGVLHVSVDTVRSHVSSILAALDVSNRTEAAMVFFERHAKLEEPVRRALSEPALAVTPIAALDTNPTVKLAAIGISRDLVSLFSRCSWFPVIALSEGCALRAAARFVITGALRAAGERFRLDVHVADMTTGLMIWSDVRDFPVGALFEVQDEVTATIVSQAYARLLATISSDLKAKSVHPQHCSTWQLAHAAFDQHHRRGRAANAAARQGFRAALAREPTFVLAHFGLGVTAYDTILNQWGPLPEASRQLREQAQRCLDLAPHMAEGHFLEARRWITESDYERARPSLESAIRTNPSFAPAHALLAQVHTINGNLDEGLARIQIATRLGPGAYNAGLAVVHFARHEWAEALAASEHVVATTADYPFGRALAAASAYWLGDKALARTHARALYQSDPTFTVKRFRNTFGKSTDLVVRLSDALEATSTG